MKTHEEIRTLVQETVDETFEGLDFYDYIMATDGLTDQEKEWAIEYLTARIILEILD